jgi:hypothetical protein
MAERITKMIESRTVVGVQGSINSVEAVSARLGRGLGSTQVHESTWGARGSIPRG